MLFHLDPDSPRLLIHPRSWFTVIADSRCCWLDWIYHIYYHCAPHLLLVFLWFRNIRKLQQQNSVKFHEVSEASWSCINYMSFMKFPEYHINNHYCWLICLLYSLLWAVASILYNYSLDWLKCFYTILVIIYKKVYSTVNVLRFVWFYLFFVMFRHSSFSTMFVGFVLGLAQHVRCFAWCFGPFFYSDFVRWWLLLFGCHAVDFSFC